MHSHTYANNISDIIHARTRRTHTRTRNDVVTAPVSRCTLTVGAERATMAAALGVGRVSPPHDAMSAVAAAAEAATTAALCVCAPRGPLSTIDVSR